MAAEPLINSWSAWSHLIAPVPYSLHLKNYQTKLLQSFLTDPQQHARACRNPKLRSGPFVDVPVERLNEIQELLTRSQAEQAESYRLAEDLVNFQNYLVNEARGQSLDHYYSELPERLRGYVELVYDYYNRAAVRLIEGLLYASPYYQKHLQSFRLFREQQDDGRPFFMSTPRLPQPKQIEWHTSFDDPRVDELFKLDCCPRPLEYIRDLIGVEDETALTTLLTAAPPPRAEKWNGPGVRIRYFGHACLLIEWNGIAILTDPNIGIMPAGGGIDRLSYADLPATIDYAVITHSHHDHFCVEPLLRLRHRIGCLIVPHSSDLLYGDPSLKLMAQKMGFRNVIELQSLDSIELPDGDITAVPFLGEHADLAHAKAAYAVRAGNQQILVAADSDCLDEHVYRHVRRALGPIEVLFIGMECVGAPLSWSCGPFFPVKPDAAIERTRRYKGCDADRALSIIRAIGARRVLLYAMGREPWLEYLLGLALSEDSTQVKEAKKLTTTLRELGHDAEILFGMADIHLNDAPIGGLIRSSQREQANGSTTLCSLPDESDQFAFE